jgi:hypothetical protein
LRFVASMQVTGQAVHSRLIKLLRNPGGGSPARLRVSYLTDMFIGWLGAGRHSWHLPRALDEPASSDSNRYCAPERAPSALAMASMSDNADGTHPGLHTRHHCRAHGAGAPLPARAARPAQR